MAYTLVPTELIVDGAVTSAKLDTNISISGTLGVTGELTLATHMIMGDNDKIKIGTGGDLEIYHDGSNSYISNSTGNIYLADTNGSVHIQAKLNEESIVCTADGAVSLYHDNAVKLATSSSGIDVTGTVVADGLTVELGGTGQTTTLINTTGDTTLFTSSANTLGDNAELVIRSRGTSSAWHSSGMRTNGLDLDFYTGEVNVSTLSSGTKHLTIASNGDISFYEDTGTTAKFFWDASAESLGIGTTSPASALEVNNSSAGDTVATFEGDYGAGGDVQLVRYERGGGAVYGAISYKDATTDMEFGNISSHALSFTTGNTRRLTIDTSGNLLVNQTSAGTNGKLQVTGDIGLTGSCTIRQSTNSDTGDTLRFLGTQFVAGSLNSMSYTYSGGGLIASLSASANALLLDVGANNSSGHRLKVQNNADGVTGILTYSGIALVGTTSTSVGILGSVNGLGVSADGGPANPIVAFADSDSTVNANSVIMEVSFQNDTSFSAYYTKFTDRDATEGSISGSGAGSVSFNTTSDERLKENIVTTSNKLEKIKQIQVRDFNYIGKDVTTTGLIAQELNTIIPDVVREGSEDATKDPWGIDYGKLTPYLMKAIQEQQTIIDDLKSRIETLENE